MSTPFGQLEDPQEPRDPRERRGLQNVYGPSPFFSPAGSPLPSTMRPTNIQGDFLGDPSPLLQEPRALLSQAMEAEGPNAPRAVGLQRLFDEDRKAWQISGVFEQRGLGAFGMALHYTGSADGAWEAVAGTVPDHEKKVQFYTAYLNAKAPAGEEIPESFVRENFEEVENRVLFEDFRRFVDDAPAMRRWLENPRNVALSRDSVRQLTELESILSTMYDSSLYQGWVGLKNLPSAITGNLQSVRADIWAVERDFELFLGRAGRYVGLGRTTDEQWQLYDWYNRQIESMQARRQELLDPLPTVTDEASFGRKVVTALPAGVADLTSFIAMGIVNPALPLAYISARSYGGKSGELRDLGLSLDKRMGIAVASATAEVLLERLQIQGVMKVLQTKSITGQFWKEAFHNATLNAVQEYTQGLSDRVATHVGETLTGEIDSVGEFFRRVGGSAYDSLVDSLVGGILGGLAAAGAVGKIRTMSRFSRQAAEAVKAAAGVSEDMPLATRSPEKAAEAINHTAREKGAKADVSISARAVRDIYNQTGRTAAELKNLLDRGNITQEEFDTAVSEDRKISFAPGDWVVKVQNTPEGVELFRHASIGGRLSLIEQEVARGRAAELVEKQVQAMLELQAKPVQTTEQSKEFRKGLVEAGWSAADANMIMQIVDRIYALRAREKGTSAKQEAAAYPVVLALGDELAELRRHAGNVTPGNDAFHQEEPVPEKPSQEYRERLENFFAPVRAALGRLRKAKSFHRWTAKKVLRRLRKEIKRDSDADRVAAGMSALEKLDRMVAEDPHRSPADFKGMLEEALLRKPLEETLGREGSEVKGSVYFADAKAVIGLFDGADRFTVLHELGHVFLYSMQQLISSGKASEQLREDYQTLTEHADGALDRSGVETIARAWEAYLVEGRAPSIALAKAFQRFTGWAINLYLTVRDLIGVGRLDLDVREVFDRWLASGEEVRTAEHFYRVYDTASELLGQERADRIAKQAERKAKEAEKEAAAEGAEESAEGAEDFTGGEVDEATLQGVKLAKEKLQASRADAIEREARRHAHLWLRSPVAQGRAKITEEVQRRVSARRPYRAIRRILDARGIRHSAAAELLTDAGDSPARIKALRKAHTRQIVKDPVRKIEQERTGMTIEEVVALAEELGYPSATEMLLALEATPPRKDVEARERELLFQEKVDAYKAALEERGHLPGAESTHTEQALEMMLLDAEALGQRVGRLREVQELRANKKAIQAAAETFIRTLPLDEARRYDRWGVQESAAANEMMEAAKKGDWDRALDAQQRRLRYFMATMASVRAREQATTRLRSLRLIKPQLKGVEAEHGKLIRYILHFWKLQDTARLSNMVTADDLPQGEVLPISDEVYEADRQRGEEVKKLGLSLDDMLPPWVLAKKLPEEYERPSQLSLNQIEDLYALVKYLREQGRGEIRAMRELGALTHESLMGTLLERLQQQKSHPRAEEPKPRVEPGEGGALARMWNSLMKLEYFFHWLDGFPLLRGEPMGPHQRIFRLGARKESGGRVRLERIYEGTRDLPGLRAQLQQINEWRRALEKQQQSGRLVIQGLPVPEKIQEEHNIRHWTAEMLILVALNEGNEGNRAMLTSEDGLGMTEEQLSRLNSQIDQPTWEALMNIGRILETLYQVQADVVKRVSGRDMERIKPYSFLVTPKGSSESLQIEGWFFPKSFDPALNLLGLGGKEGAQDLMATANKDSLYGYANRPASGQTISRRKDAAGNDLVTFSPRLEIWVLERYIKDAVHMVQMLEYVTELDRITRDQRWMKEVVRIAGQKKYEEVRRWLNDVARPRTKDKEGLGEWINRRAVAVTVLGLGYRVWTGFKQRLSTFAGINGMAGVGGGLGPAIWYYLKGVNSVAGHSLKERSDPLNWGRAMLYGRQTEGIMNWVHGLSPDMAIRSKTFETLLGEELRGLRLESRTLYIGGRAYHFGEQFNGFFRKTQELAFWWIRANDAATVYPLWIGTFLMAKEQGLNEIRDDMPEAERDRRAAQLADGVVALSQPAAKVIDQARLQRSSAVINRAASLFMSWRLIFFGRMKEFVTAKMRGEIGWSELIRYFALEVLTPAAILAGLPYAFMSPEEEEEADPFWAALAKQVAGDVTAPIPVAGGVASRALHGYRGSASLPAMRGVEELARAGMSVGRKAWEAGRQAVQGEEVDPWNLAEASADAVYFLAWWFKVPVTNIPEDLDKSLRDVGVVENRPLRERLEQ